MAIRQWPTTCPKTASARRPARTRDQPGHLIGLPRLSLVAQSRAVPASTLIAAAPLAALELPLRLIVWEDGYQTKISYPSPAEVTRRYGMDDDLAAALASIDQVISTVIDR